MKKLLLIIEREFLSKVRNRTFIIMTFLSPVLMVGMIALVALLTKSSIEKNTSVAYVDASGLFSPDDFKSKTIDFENMTEIGFEKAKEIGLKDEEQSLGEKYKEEIDYNYTLIRFLKKTPPLVGIDLLNYGPFEKEDIANVPLKNANILLNEKTAEKIEIP